VIFVLAPDSFKESMSAQQACAAMETGIKKAMPDATCLHVPLADGGEGTLHALVAATGGKIYKHPVTDPLGKPVTGEYGILGDGQTGMVELASASGLHLVPPASRNPLLTSTFGTGELIKKVLSHNITKLIIGLGGSATNDGGAGLAQALGVKFLNELGREIEPGGGNMHKIHRIDLSQIVNLPQGLTVEVACDVTNPLTGPMGAAHIYSPQKGATPEMIKQLDQGLKHYAGKIQEYVGKTISEIPGAGAAGGAGAGLMAFLNARLVSGIDLVIKHAGLAGKISQADYVFTGEGSIDSQTVQGKTISGVVALAKEYRKPVIAFAGKVADTEALYQMGLTAVFGILPEVVPLEMALATGESNLANTTTAAVKLILAASDLK
jgi:glycerate kinase